jgi:Holliday junction resolvase RusA-like endonuclease
MTGVEFRVLGLPSPQAGMRAVPTGAGVRHITTGGTGLAVWRGQVSLAALAQAHALGKAAPLMGPLALEVAFQFPMPRSRPASVRAAGRAPKSTKPDIDKLLRAVCDSLTVAGLIADDALISTVLATKQEVANDWTGAAIRVRQVGAP